MDKMLYHHICGLPLELCDCPDQQKHIKNISFHKEPKLEPEFRPQGIVKDLKKIQLNGGYCEPHKFGENQAIPGTTRPKSDYINISFPPDWDEAVNYYAYDENRVVRIIEPKKPDPGTFVKFLNPEPKKNHSLLIPITVMALFIACLIGGLV